MIFGASLLPECTYQDCDYIGLPMNIFNTTRKEFVILTIVFLTRIATVDMVLWDDTRIVPSDSPTMGNTVHME